MDDNGGSRSEDVDPDEYLWETLPGRCCFMANADSCDTCNVWSGPENFCHTSRENCELCGAWPALLTRAVSRGTNQGLLYRGAHASSLPSPLPYAVCTDTPAAEALH